MIGVPSAHFVCVPPVTLLPIIVHPPHPFVMSQYTVNSRAATPVMLISYSPSQVLFPTSLILLQLPFGAIAWSTVPTPLSFSVDPSPKSASYDDGLVTASRYISPLVVKAAISSTGVLVVV